MTPRLIWLCVVLHLVPAVAGAQGTSADDVVTFLVLNQAVPTGDFTKDAQAADATRATLVRSLLVELATFPITTAAGGFSYRFDPALGTLQRVSQGFGPFLLDRASTVGGGHGSVSLTYRSSVFSTLDGRNLRGGAFVTSANKFRDEPEAFDVDRLTLDMRTDTVTFLATYGITNRIDVGVAVPFVRLVIDGERSNTYRGSTRVQAQGRAESVGLADLPIRSKILLFDAVPARLSAAFDVQLPTGDPDNLRGSGQTSLKSAVLASVGSGDIELHLNAGLITGGLARQTFGGASVTASVGSALTISGEALMRHVAGPGGIQEVTEPHPLFAGVDTTRLLPAYDGTVTATLVAGVRWNVATTWLLNVYTLVPLTDTGLNSRPTPAFSIDYSFVR